MPELSAITSFDGTTIAYVNSASIDDRSRPLAICTHGFPDTPNTWRHLVPRLEHIGYRVAAPYLRGYAPSGVPEDGCVQTAAGACDLLALHDQLGGDERAVAIGHDWGAPITYTAAGHEPDRWSRVVGLAVPPGGSFGASLTTDLAQVRRSWYMFFFQHPLADIVVPADDMAFIDMLWSDWSPGYDATDELGPVKDALADPANLAAAIGYYRAALSGIGTRDDLAGVTLSGQAMPPQPTLYLHGDADPCIGSDVAAAASTEAPANVCVEMIDDATHFLHLEQPDLVNQHIVDFLS